MNNITSQRNGLGRPCEYHVDLLDDVKASGKVSCLWTCRELFTSFRMVSRRYSYHQWLRPSLLCANLPAKEIWNLKNCSKIRRHVRRMRGWNRGGETTVVPANKISPHERLVLRFLFLICMLTNAPFCADLNCFLWLNYVYGVLRGSDFENVAKN